MGKRRHSRSRSRSRRRGRGFGSFIKKLAGGVAKGVKSAVNLAKNTGVISKGLAMTGNPMAAGAAGALGFGRRRRRSRSRRRRGGAIVA